MGRAILAYRGAERLVPSDPRLEHNLAYARSLRRDRIEQSGGRQLASALLAWRNAVPARTRFAIFAAAWTALWAALLARAVWRPRGGRWVVVGLAAVSLVTGLSAGAELLADDRGGVLLADEVIVRKGNGEGFAPRFEEPLHAGVEFRLLERRADWLLVELANGRSGWVRTDQAGLVE